MWIYICIIGTIISGFSGPLFKKVIQSNDRPSSSKLMISGLIWYHILMLIITTIYNQNYILELNINTIIRVFPGILFQTIGFFCAINSIKNANIAFGTGIRKCNTVIILILSVIFLNETITIIQLILAIIIIILTIVLALDKKVSDKGENKKKAILYAYGFAIFNGLASFLGKVYINELKDSMYLIFNYAIIVLVVTSIYIVFTKRYDLISIRRINNKKFFIFYVISDGLSSMLNKLSLVDGPASIVYVISSTSILVTILISKILLKEKLNLKTFIIIILIIISVVLLTILA